MAAGGCVQVPREKAYNRLFRTRAVAAAKL